MAHVFSLGMSWRSFCDVPMSFYRHFHLVGKFMPVLFCRARKLGPSDGVRNSHVSSCSSSSVIRRCGSWVDEHTSFAGGDDFDCLLNRARGRFDFHPWRS